MSIEAMSGAQQWLLDHSDKYVVRSKVKDEAVLFENGNIKYSCELEVSVNCLELILKGLITEDPTEAEHGVNAQRHSIFLKKIIASLVEEVARHALVIDYSPPGSNINDGGDDAFPPGADALKVINEGESVTITECLDLHFVPPVDGGEGASCRPTIRLVQSSLKRNIKRKKAKPRYPAYMWVLGGAGNKRIIPPRHATDFYYRLLEGKVGYPLNYLGACINDLESRGIVEVLGKRLALTKEGAELAERLFGGDNGKGAICWKVRVSRKKR